MIFDLKLLNTMFALIASLGIFSLYLVARAWLANEKLEKYSAEVLDAVTILKKAVYKQNIADKHISELEGETKEAFRLLMSAYAVNIHGRREFSAKILELINRKSEKYYSLYDIYNAFEKGNMNGFMCDLLVNGGFLFSNLVYLSQLKLNGFEYKYRTLASESKLGKI